MSGLGELLLGKASNRNERSQQQGDRLAHNNNRDAKVRPAKHDNEDQRHDRDDELRDSSGRHRAEEQFHQTTTDNVQRVFPNRIEKETKQEDDSRSNASSVDDYVRELLDPNDRPRNVWHVVEGPKGSPSDGRHHNRTKEESRYNERSPNCVETEANMEISPEHRNSTKSKAEPTDYEPRTPGRKDHQDRRNLDRDRDRGRSSPSRHRHSSRDKDKHRHRDDRNRHDHDRRRSSSSRHRSHRRHDQSDEEDADYERRHRSKGGRYGRKRRSTSRSRSRSVISSSGRRDRSESGSPSRNPRTVIVMQLSQRVISKDLEDYFDENVGNVREVRLIMDGRNRRHKGVAYIEFNDSKSASNALSLNGRKLHGTSLIIQPVSSRSSDHHSSASLIHPSSRSHHTSSSIYPSSRSLPPNAYRVYIGALHLGVTDEMLRTIVEPFGPVLRVEVIKDRTTGQSRGYAFVTFANAENGQEAVRNLDGFELAGKNMRVSKSTEKSEH